MKSVPVERTDWSLKNAAIYLLSASILIGVMLLPDALFSGYSDLVNTLTLVALYGLIARVLIGTVLSVFWPTPPSIDTRTDLPLVSIVVPAYNEEAVLGDAIDACLDLEYPSEKLEIVICYEGSSTDSTAEIAERAAAGHSHIHALEHDEPNGAKATAVNYALEWTSGNIVATIDADHQFKPDAVRRAVAWFLHDPGTWCVQGRCYGINPTDSLMTLHATVERHIAEMADLYGREQLNGFTIFGGGQVFFRPEVFDSIGDFDEQVMVEDIDMSAKIHLAGKRLRADPGIITYEENPPNLKAWWTQRKRWARGWMQVTRRYFASFLTQSNCSFSTKADATFTFMFAVVPALLAFTFPIPASGLLTEASTVTFVPHDWVLWTILPLMPAVAAYPIFVRDYLEGMSHHPLEYVAALTLGPYFGLQMLVFATAFLDEFLLTKPRVFVTTMRAE